MTRRFGPVDLVDIPKVWPVVLPLVEATLAEFGDRGHNAQDYRDACEAREQQIWVAMKDAREIDGVAFTELLLKPRRKIARVTLLAGRDLHGWFPIASPVLYAWAREMGASVLEMVGRPGWSRSLPGWRVDEVVMRKELHDA
jgi:hypothetical protein